MGATNGNFSKHPSKFYNYLTPFFLSSTFPAHPPPFTFLPHHFTPLPFSPLSKIQTHQNHYYYPMENTTSTYTTCTCTPLSTDSPQLGLQLSPPLHNNNNVDVTVKEEEEEEEEEYSYNFDGDDDDVELEQQVPSSSSDDVAKPCEKLHEMMGGTQPPPFLKKTYEMVENPETNEVLSWGYGGFSFVVWDPYKFSTDLLPKFFKHSNFSSFIRQLNTYGFRKVHFDQWEFANAGFQRDKKHLLKSIKRKRHGSANSNPRFKLQTETDVEKLKLDQEALKVEIDELKNQQLNSNQSLAAMEERIKHTEWKHKELLLFLAKAMKNTSLFQQLLQKYRQNKSLENERVSKRRRLASTLKDPNTNCCHEGEFVGGIHESEANSFLEFSPTIGLGTLSGLTSETETNSPDLSSGNYIMWEKLMEDDVICEDQEEVFDDSQTKFVHELEDLIGKPPVSTVVGEVACPGGQ